MAYAISAIRRAEDGSFLEVRLHRIIDFSDPPLILETGIFSVEHAIALAKQDRLRIHIQSAARYFVAVGEGQDRREILIDLPETPERLRLRNLPSF